jgi:two-component system, chemotaxis family, protein-glutamate methylesterase/glutaminase
VGHRWSPQSLFEEQSSSVERALWLAVRALDERGRLAGAIREVAGGMTAEVEPAPGGGAGTVAQPGSSRT